MAQFKIYVRQTITYDHEIIVECDNEDYLEVAISDIEKHAYDNYYGNNEEIANELEDEDIKVIGTIEDASGDWEFEFDYEEVTNGNK